MTGVSSGQAIEMVSVLKQEMAEPGIKEEIVDQTSDIKHEITDVSKQENCSSCADVKKCKSELLEPDCKCNGNFFKDACCNQDTNPVDPHGNENQSDKNVVCEKTAEINMSLFSFHSDERPFRCSQCEYSCKSNSNLSRHMKQVHSDERPFSCPQCQFSCKIKSILTWHMKQVHSDERPFSCSQCQYSFKTKGNLNTHMQYVHSDERPFSCSHCQYSFKTKGNLIKHVKFVHSD